MTAQNPIHGAQVGNVSAAEPHVLPGIGRTKALFFAAAFLSFLMSVYLFFGGSREQGIFVGIWVPSILSAGALLLGRNARE